MIRYRRGGFALALIAISCLVEGAPIHRTPLSEDRLRLTAKTGFQREGGFYYVELRNRSDEFICLDQAQLDSRFPNLSIKTAAGTAVKPLSIAEPVSGSDLGFNYSAAYVFLKPGSSRRVYLNTKNFSLTPGEYWLSGLISYYRCADIIDKERLSARRTIHPYFVRLQGRLRYTAGGK